MNYALFSIFQIAQSVYLLGNELQNRDVVPFNAEARFYPFSHVQADSGAHRITYSVGTEDWFPRRKSQGVKLTTRGVTSTPPISLHGIQNKFPSTSLFFSLPLFHSLSS
jgi:hypothetical protein